MNQDENKPRTTKVAETLEMGVEGMTCDHCAGRVEKALRGVAGVQEVRVDRARASASVRFDASKTGAAQLHEAVRKSGYRPVPK